MVWRKCKVSAGIFEQCLIPNSSSLIVLFSKKLSFIVHILNPYTPGEKQHSSTCSIDRIRWKIDMFGIRNYPRLPMLCPMVLEYL